MTQKILVLSLFITVLVYPGLAGAQQAGAQDVPRHSITVAPVLGAHFIPENPHFLNDRILGADIIYGFDLRGREDSWMRILNAREFGIGLSFRDLNRLDGHLDTSANSIGKAIGIAAQVEFELFDAGPVQFYLIPSVGISYLTKSYFTHPKNRFIGSHLNQMLKAALQMEIPLNEKFSLLANTHVLHLSNGGYNIPNSGINTGNVSIGLKSRFGNEPYKKTKDEFVPLGRNTAELVAGIGRRGVYQRHKGMAKSGLYAGYNYWLNEVLDLKLGLDAVYYFTVFDTKNRSATYQHYGTSYDRWRLGVSLGAEIKMSRFAINGRYGRYLHYNSLHDINYYWNSGVKYYITPHLGLQSTLHMHRFQADFVDFGFVVKL